MDSLGNNQNDLNVISIQKSTIYKFSIFILLVAIVFLVFKNPISTNANVIQQQTVINGIQKASLVDGKQEINMDVDYSGWNPKVFALKKGVPVKWVIDGKELTGCNSAIISKDFNINKKLNQGENIIEFTPNNIGSFTFTCSMGMLRGQFIVTETGEATQQQISSASQQSTGGSCGGSSGGCGCGGAR